MRQPSLDAQPCVNLSIYTAPAIQALLPETASAQTVAGTPSSSCATTLRYAVYAVVVSCTCTWPSARACGPDTDRARSWPSDSERHHQAQAQADDESLDVRCDKGRW